MRRKAYAMKNMAKGILFGLTKNAQHILVTGHSGAGKSTKAKEISEGMGMPLVQLDLDPRWQEFIHNSRKNIEKLPSKKVYQLTRGIVDDALKEEIPSVIEGAQILRHPIITKGNKIIVVDLPEDQILKQRFEREKRIGLEKRRWNPEFAEALGKELIDFHRNKVKRFRNMPGVEIYNPYDKA